MMMMIKEIKSIVRRKMLLPRTAWLGQTWMCWALVPLRICALRAPRFTVPRHKDPLHILLYPGHCGDPASTRHTTPVAAPELNASPVQFSCWKHSGAGPGLHISLSKGSGDFHCFIYSPWTGCRWCLSVTWVNVAFRVVPIIAIPISALFFVCVNESFLL